MPLQLRLQDEVHELSIFGAVAVGDVRVVELPVCRRRRVSAALPRPGCHFQVPALRAPSPFPHMRTGLRPAPQTQAPPTTPHQYRILRGGLETADWPPGPLLRTLCSPGLGCVCPSPGMYAHPSPAGLMRPYSPPPEPLRLPGAALHGGSLGRLIPQAPRPPTVHLHLPVIVLVPELHVEPALHVEQGRQKQGQQDQQRGQHRRQVACGAWGQSCSLSGCSPHPAPPAPRLLGPLLPVPLYPPHQLSRE